MNIEPGTKVIVSGSVWGTFIGTADSGRAIIDLGTAGTLLVEPGNVQALVAAERISDRHLLRLAEAA